MLKICQARNQDIDGRNDKFCIECWIESSYDAEFPFTAYLDREDCMRENLLTEKEYDEMLSKAIRKRGTEVEHCGRISNTSMSAGISKLDHQQSGKG